MQSDLEMVAIGVWESKAEAYDNLGKRKEPYRVDEDDHKHHLFIT